MLVYKTLENNKFIQLERLRSVNVCEAIKFMSFRVNISHRSKSSHVHLSSPLQIGDWLWMKANLSNNKGLDIYGNVLIVAIPELTSLE